MTYLRRALKYFIQMSLLLAVIIGALMAFGMVSKDIAVAFRHGWTSVAWIAGLFAVMSLAYPFFGYQKRRISLQGDPAEYRKDIVDALAPRGYVLSGEEDGVLKFRLTSPVNRAARMWADTVTLTPVLGGLEAEGLTRDLVRVVSSIEHKLRNHGND